MPHFILNWFLAQHAVAVIIVVTCCYISDVSMFAFHCTQFKTMFVLCFIAAVLPLVVLKIFRVHFHGELSAF